MLGRFMFILKMASKLKERIKSYQKCQNTLYWSSSSRPLNEQKHKIWVFYCYPHLVSQPLCKKLKQVFEAMCLDKERLLKIPRGRYFKRIWSRQMLTSYCTCSRTMFILSSPHSDRSKDYLIQEYTKNTSDRSRSWIRKCQNDTV